jgi:hypothetical protein
MKQEIPLNENQKKQFHSIMAGMKFIDVMKEKGYTVDEAFAALEQIMEGNK